MSILALKKKIMGNTGTAPRESIIQCRQFIPHEIIQASKAYISNDIGTRETSGMYKLDI